MEFTNISQAKKQAKLSYIGNTNSSAKIIKGIKKNVDTFIVYLAPFNLSGYNVCPKATIDGCVKLCLHKSGRNKMLIKGQTETTTDRARIAKTKLFFEEREFFNAWVISEIKTAYNKAISKGRDFSVRFNGTSDINIETIKQGNKNLFQLFPHIQFYDYTKVYNRLQLTKKYPNYNLTFSYSGGNMLECFNALQEGYNVAVPFYKVLPTTFAGYKVINGDETDLRYMDESNVIVGLKYKIVRGKKEADILSNDFIIKQDNKLCVY